MSGFIEQGLGVPSDPGGIDPSLIVDEEVPPEQALPREKPEPEPRRQRLVEECLSEVELGLRRWKKRFAQMRHDTRFAAGDQWNTAATANDPNADAPEMRYVANITQRHVQQRVSGLYAKNPRFVAQPRRRMATAVWDGDPQTLESAKQALLMSMAHGMPPDPQTQAILADASAAVERKKLVRRVCRTVELQLGYEISEARPSFKSMMKVAVRRAVTTGVGWVKLGYHRPPQLAPEMGRTADASERLALIERIAADIADERVPMDAAEAERLRLTLEGLRKPQQYLRREGLSFDWPASTDIIPDYCMTNLRGFLGCRWVAQRYALTPERVQQVYGVDVRSSYRAYSRDALKEGHEPPEIVRGHRPGDPASGGDPERADTLAMVYEMWCIEDGLIYIVCDGYPEFLRDPAPPEYFTERFWPWFLVAFNESDDVENPWPLSDVQLIRDAQLEINRARQGLREHRRANRPKTIIPEDAVDEEDERKLTEHPANAVISLRGLQPGQKVGDLLQPWQGPPIDPALYDVKAAYEDVLRVAGSQEANLGGTSDATATETAIAENSRTSALSSAIDDLDDTLNDISQAATQMLLAEMPEIEVRRSVGPGAVWPDLSVDDIAAELFVQVEAGSTGRPNRAARIAEFERVAPILLQVPGVKPDKLAEYALSLMADNLEVTDFLDPSAPSIAAMNAAKPDNGAHAAPGQAPAEQGGQGEMNAPKAKQQQTLGPQPNQPPTPVFGPAKGLVN
jgi:hypothetical protein